MSKVGEHDVFQLIQSMNPSEKRYFRTRVHMPGNGETVKYLRLFEVLNSLETYSKQAVLQKIPEIKPAQLPNLKSRLYKSLLRSLQECEAMDVQSRFHVGQLRGHIETLCNKGLFEQAVRAAKRAKKAAYRYEYYELLPEILWWEREAYYQAAESITDMERELAENSAEQQKISLTISNLAKLSVLRYRIYSLFSHQGRIARDPKQVQQILALAKEAKGLLSTELTFREQRTTLHTLIQSYMMLVDCEQLLRHCHSLHELFEMEPIRKQVYFKEYARCLNTYTIALNMAEKYDEALCMVQRTQNLPRTIGFKMNPTQLGEVFDFHAFHRLETYIWTGRFDEGVKLIPELEDGLKKYTPYMNPVNMHSKYYRIALVYFGAGEYRKSLHWVNTILNNVHLFRQDIQAGVRLLNLILHFELQNIPLLEYAVKSTYRYLNKAKRLYETENVLLRFLRRLQEIQDRKMLREAFRELLQEMTQLFQRDPLEKYAIPYFDITSWLESKVSEKSFADCVRSKLETQKG